MTSEAKASPLSDSLVLKKSGNNHVTQQVGNCNWDYKGGSEHFHAIMKKAVMIFII